MAEGRREGWRRRSSESAAVVVVVVVAAADKYTLRGIFVQDLTSHTHTLSLSFTHSHTYTQRMLKSQKSRDASTGRNKMR